MVTPYIDLCTNPTFRYFMVKYYENVQNLGPETLYTKHSESFPILLHYVTSIHICAFIYIYKVYYTLTSVRLGSYKCHNTNPCVIIEFLAKLYIALFYPVPFLSFHRTKFFSPSFALLYFIIYYAQAHMCVR